ncbi:bifunctional phosphatase PAP2/diacylglycerol kinase family protein [Mycobacterium sp.]|uniref:bifunctional phosphatase PAP2/diacylglycerol kinase family protein n=1 Tax=Mycobacterium sp. TaxID=1785 RepID=UPI003F95528F
MKMGERHTSRGLRQITEGLGVLDAEVFQAVANSSSPLLDTAMPALTRAADHAKLWLAIAAGLAMSGSRSAHRGAGRGVVSLAVTSLITNQLAKRAWHRNRPGHRSVPLARRLRRYPTSDSLPSGHAASAAAFVVGVGLENPTLGILLAVLAWLVGFSRVVTGAHYPGDVLAGFGIGSAIAGLGGRLVPPIVAPRLPIADPLRIDAPPRPDGAGVVLVVNPAAGSGNGERVIAQVRRELPKAEIVTLGASDNLEEVLRGAAHRAEVLGIGGGDGTVACAAAVAVRTGRPLAVFPAGTFNHFAKDIGCDNAASTVRAIRAGTVSCVDLVCFNDARMVLNTASIGAYHQRLHDGGLERTPAAAPAHQRRAPKGAVSRRRIHRRRAGRVPVRPGQKGPDQYRDPDPVQAPPPDRCVGGRGCPARGPAEPGRDVAPDRARPRPQDHLIGGNR